VIQCNCTFRKKNGDALVRHDVAWEKEKKGSGLGNGRRVGQERCLCERLEAGAWIAPIRKTNYRWSVKVSKQLLEFARQFAIGEVSADDFADSFMKRWKQERDAGGTLLDSDEVSECLSTIFCFADLYNPEAGREEYELDETKLRYEIRKVMKM